MQCVLFFLWVRQIRPRSAVQESMHGAALSNDSKRYAQQQGAALQTLQPLEQKQMLCSAALRFSVCGSPITKVTCGHPTLGRNATTLIRRNAGRSWATTWLENLGTLGGDASAQQVISLANCHSSSCALAKHGVIRATIWHALLPSSYYLSVGGHDKVLARNRSAAVAAAAAAGNAKHNTGLISLNATGCKDGSWNVASDARPARWLHGSNSAWLLFGFCSCFSLAASSGKIGTSAVACCEAKANPVTCGPSNDADEKQQVAIEETHGKKVYKDYSVIGIPGDGRCLFRAVAHGVCNRSGKPTNDENYQREFADELRDKVVDELVKRRDETEWFIEGDFDLYAKRMREPHVWGGEPELLMLSHVLQIPITVYMSDRSSKGLIAIAEYGQEYGKDNPVRVLYHGFGHYDALQMPQEEAAQQSKL